MEVSIDCSRFVDEAVDDALDMVGLHVGQSCFRTYSEDALPVLLEEHSLINDFVRPDTVPVKSGFFVEYECKQCEWYHIPLYQYGLFICAICVNIMISSAMMP